MKRTILFLLTLLLFAPLTTQGQFNLSREDSLEIELRQADEFLTNLMQRARITIPKEQGRIDTVANFERVSPFVHVAYGDGGRYIASIVEEGVLREMGEDEYVVTAGKVRLYLEDPVSNTQKYVATIIVVFVKTKSVPQKFS